ncbi:hypothetical protein AGMMS50268_05150 [Spirochaetia bacterium]|nr:hypothetical protein AGMMS50268_05150 [Spirochaetia bacterium]
MRFFPYFLLPLVLTGMVALSIPLGVERADDSALQILFSEGRFCNLFTINYSFNDDPRGLRGLFPLILVILSGSAALEAVFASFFLDFQHKIPDKALDNSSFLGPRGPPVFIPA